MKVTLSIDCGEQGHDFSVDVTPEALEAIRHKFNPSGLETVNRLKDVAAIYLSLIQKYQTEKPESGREFAVAKTEVQTASMWAVLGATKGL